MTVTAATGMLKQHGINGMTCQLVESVECDQEPFDSYCSKQITNCLQRALVSCGMLGHLSNWIGTKHQLISGHKPSDSKQLCNFLPVVYVTSSTGNIYRMVCDALVSNMW